MKYAAIAAHVGAYTVAFMCRVLGVAPSGYYAWLKCPTSKRAQQDDALQPHVRAAFQASKQRYGSPRVHAELRAQGHRVGRKRVARLMREDGLRARSRRRFRHTTLSKHCEPVAPNVVARQFEVSAPNQVWVSDLTYLPTQTGFAYLAVILDLFARRVVGWAVSDNLDATVAVTALQRALALRPAPAGLLHHSDRGVHYACADYRAVLENHGVRRSMSRKGNCWDNAVAESFFSSLKFELEDNAQWRDAHDVEHDVAAYIDGFYNADRRHSHNR
ncbi:MAG: Mobile element protein [Myxococcales bacterium]|nr:Mobile element protein [Myxococcales bacterium]